MNMKFITTNVLRCSAMLAMLLLAGCGGGDGGTGNGTVFSPASSSSSSSSSSLPAPTNVAASVNGGVASATFDATHAPYVNDTDTSNVFYWVANVANDYVTVTFNRVYAISQIRLHTNATITTDTRLQASSDGTNFSDLSYTTTGGAGDCFSVTISVSGNLITCSFGTTPRSLRAVRVVIPSNTNISMKQIREIEVIGQ